MLTTHRVQDSKLTQIDPYHTYSGYEHYSLTPHGVGYIAVTKLLLYT
jgi:hypothetical protein